MTARTASYWLAIIAVALLALPYGGVRPWAWSLYAVTVGVALVLWAWASLTDPSAPRVRLRRVAWAAGGMMLVFAWATFQLLGLSPAAWHHPLWQAGGSLLAMKPMSAISLNPAAGRAELTWLLALVATFWLALQHGRSERHARTSLIVIATMAVACATYGMVVHLSGAATIFGQEKWAYGNQLTATFVSANHFAAWGGLSLLATTALLFRTGDRLVATEDNPLSRGALLFALDRLRFTDVAILLALFVIFSAVLLTGSRAGMANMIGAAGLFGALMVVKHFRDPRAIISFAIAGVIIVVIVAAAASESTLKRLNTVVADSEARGQVHGLALEAIADRPWLGYGLGAFPEVYQLYRDERVAAATPRFDHAHSSPLELVVELGLPAGVLMMAVVGGLAIRCAVGVFVRRRRTTYPAMGVAAVALIAVHGLVDFPLATPAVGALFAWLLGLGVAQSFRARTALD
ncbi:MAG: O-antigen ligase family protein [Alphaproteobacteria bacterium]